MPRTKDGLDVYAMCWYRFIQSSQDLRIWSQPRTGQLFRPKHNIRPTNSPESASVPPCPQNLHPLPGKRNQMQPPKPKTPNTKPNRSFPSLIQSPPIQHHDTSHLPRQNLISPPHTPQANPSPPSARSAAPARPDPCPSPGYTAPGASRTSAARGGRAATAWLRRA